MNWLTTGTAPAATEKPKGREVRLLTDDEEGEQIMPKGVYDRAARAKPAQPANDAAAEPKKRGRKPRAENIVPKVARAALNAAKGRFEVALDLRGGAVTINAASGSLTLAPDEVLALFAFIGRRGL